ncbi:MAG: methylthioribulose 1-phosphate dehydratase [Gemmataceae bacterium]
MTLGEQFDMVDPLYYHKEALMELGGLFYDWGWSFGTSSNYSMVVGENPLRLLITASGKDKGSLEPDDFVVVDDKGQPTETVPGKPSAETMIHVMLAQRPNVASILHTHSVWGTMLSQIHADDGGFFIEGYEMLKGLQGVKTHDHKEWVSIFPNTQNIPTLAQDIQKFLDTDPRGQHAHGLLIQGHGLYTWGKDLQEAQRHIEIFEFLFEVVARLKTR